MGMEINLLSKILWVINENAGICCLAYIQITKAFSPNYFKVEGKFLQCGNSAMIVRDE